MEVHVYLLIMGTKLGTGWFPNKDGINLVLEKLMEKYMRYLNIKKVMAVSFTLNILGLTVAPLALGNETNLLECYLAVTDEAKPANPIYGEQAQNIERLASEAKVNGPATQAIVPPDLFRYIEKIFDDDNAKRDTSQDTKSHLLVHRSESGEVMKKEIAVVLVHGLYNPTSWISELGMSIFEDGHNVIIKRLPGHYDGADKRALDNTSRFEWYADADQNLRMARELGQKVVLVGHSLGGALALRAAIKDNRDVAGIVLLAPVLEVAPITKLQSWLTSKTWFGLGPIVFRMLGITRLDETQRYISSSAGVETARIISDIRKMGGSKQYAYDQLAKIPILSINTTRERTVDRALNRKVMENHVAQDASGKNRSLTVDGPLHRHITLADPKLNPDAPLIYSEINDFIDSLRVP